MKSISQPTQEKQLSIIRTETVFSRLPIHTLSKKGDISIHITRRNDEGETELYWEVAPNQKYGAPRQLAYHLDTLVINRRLDEVNRPLPEVIKIGSLRELRRELGSNEPELKRALRQNATVAITAKFTYKDKNGTEQYIDGTFSRYGVIFTGERLPDGRKADAVYIILNKPYRDILNNAPVRPLNYDYLKQLPPAAQRFYEIISYRIYGSIKHNQDYATLPYSEFCTCSGLSRYYERDKVKKQMYKVHRPHIKSGYIEKVSYESIVDSEEKDDWTMRYVIGKKAREEYKTFHTKRLEKGSEAHDTLTGLAQTLYERGIRPASKARQLEAQYSEERINEKLAMHDSGMIKEIGGLINAIENDWYPTEAQRKAKAATTREQIREQIAQLEREREEAKKSYEERCGAVFQELTTQHPDQTREAMEEAVSGQHAVLSGRYDPAKPFSEQSIVVRVMTKTKLRQKFPDLFRIIDDEHQQIIATINAKITELRQQPHTQPNQPQTP